MKKALKITGIVLLSIILLMIIIPFAFKGKIVEIVKKEVNKTLTVDIDFKKIGINLFSEFPYLAINIHELSAVGREEFPGDTLAYINKLHLAVNVKSIFGDDGIEIRKINLHHPIVNLLVDTNGKANFDVMKSSETDGASVTEETPAPEATDTTGSFKLLIKDLIITKAKIVYDDKEANMKLSVDDLDFRLSGDLAADMAMLKLKLEIAALSYKMDGISYLNKAKTTFSGDIEADLKNNRYTLKKNLLAVNALAFDIDGWVAMIGDDMDMDLSLKANKSDFKNFLSLIPAVYSKDFDKIQTAGTLGFSAAAKGKLTESSFPAFDINLLIENAMFKYPDLPKSVDNIQLDVRANSPGGDLDNAVVDVKKLHLEMGNNPFDIRLSLKKPISNPTFDFMAKGVVNLDLIRDFYPLDEENMDINGVLTADLAAKGDMNSIDKEAYENVNINGVLSLLNGTFKTDMIKDKVDINNFNLDFSQKYVHLLTALKVGRNDIKADGRVENFIGYLLRDDVIKGKLKINSGYLNINDFMEEETVASSSSETAPVGETEPMPEDTASSLSAIEIPKNIDLLLQLDINQLIFDKIDMQKVSGDVAVKDQTLDLKNLFMKALGGNMKVSGTYAAQNIEQPKADISLKIDHVDIKETGQTFVTVQKLLPIIEHTSGTMSLEFNLKSNFDKNLNPDYNTLNASGKISSPGVEIANMEVLNTLADVLKMEKLRKIALDKINLSFTCREGRVTTAPFDIKTGNIKATVSGSTGLDETIDYLINAKIPRSELGANANALLESWTGNIFGTGINVKLPDVLEIPIKIGGTFKKPTVNISGMGDMGKDIIDDLVDQGKEKINEQIDKFLEEARKQRDKLIAEAEKQRDKIVSEAQKQKDNLVAQARTAGEKLVSEADKQGQELIKKAGSNIIAKKAAEEGAKKLKDEAQKQSDRLVKEAENQGNKLVNEAKKQGDKLVDEARKQGDKLIEEAEKKKL